jgi:membrane-associated protein
MTVSSGATFDVNLLALLLLIAAVVGDAVNYAVGRRMGQAVFEKKDSKIFKQQYLMRTQKFFDKYGNKAIVLARFVPIVRTFAPFLAGVGTMPYRKFATYNVLGAVLWVGFFTYMGWWVGERPEVKKNFGLVIIGIIILSVVPGVIEIIRARKEARQHVA